jgi:GPH family glycoside/pentoside/hexuronide:cation symporter
MKTIFLKERLAYSLPAFALAIIGIPVYVYIPKFYTDVVGIDIAVAGVLLFGVRLFDAVTDPLMGTLSDRTRSRFGRRRPYIVSGSILIAIALIFLFNPPAASVTWNTVWFAFWIYALFLFWTLVTVPYESLGPEITYDYDERTSLFAWRDGFLIAGTLAAAASPALVQAVFQTGDDADGQRSQFFWISVIYAPLVVGMCGWCVRVIRERDQVPSVAAAIGWRDMRTVFANRPFMILLAAYTISAIGSNLPATLILYYVQYVLGSSRADLFLLLYFVTGILLLPVWVRLAHRFGRKETWIASMAVNTGAFMGVFFLGPGRYGDLRCSGDHLRHRIRRHPGPAVGHPGRCDRLRRTENRPPPRRPVHRSVVHRQKAGRRCGCGCGTGRTRCRRLHAQRSAD